MGGPPRSFSKFPQHTLKHVESPNPRPAVPPPSTDGIHTLEHGVPRGAGGQPWDAAEPSPLSTSEMSSFLPFDRARVKLVRALIKTCRHLEQGGGGPETCHPSYIIIPGKSTLSLALVQFPFSTMEEEQPALVCPRAPDLGSCVCMCVLPGQNYFGKVTLSN